MPQHRSQIEWECLTLQNIGEMLLRMEARIDVVDLKLGLCYEVAATSDARRSCNGVKGYKLMVF